MIHHITVITYSTATYEGHPEVTHGAEDEVGTILAVRDGLINRILNITDELLGSSNDVAHL